MEKCTPCRPSVDLHMCRSYILSSRKFHVCASRDSCTTSVGKPQVGDACQVCTLQNSELTYSMRQKESGKELHPSANNHRPYPSLRLSQALGAVQLEAGTWSTPRELKYWTEPHIRNHNAGVRTSRADEEGWTNTSRPNRRSTPPRGGLFDLYFLWWDFLAAAERI